jgi:16S rRNA (uracil1498-N3)-methyltransferase
MSERFYVNLPLTTGPFTLDGPEAHHLATVCRLRPGNEVCLFNGDGCEYPARIMAVARREITLEIVGVDQPPRELPFKLEVAAPLPKGDRSQFLVEKLTELGVTTFVPLACERSVFHPREGKREKLERYVIEASKQCGRNLLMQISETITWERYVGIGNVEELRIVAHPYQETTSAELAQRVKGRSAIRIAVGPEGGFTDDEVTLAKSHGWQAANLGPRILRVETAALVLAAHVADWFHVNS